MKQYVENNTPNTMYVAGVAIAPGEGREVELPGGGPATDQAGTDEVEDRLAPLRELLAGNVAAVIASLVDLSEDTLKALQALENAAEKPRKGVLVALADKLIAIADNKLQSDDLDDPLGTGTGGAQQPPAGQ
jgi:hypothetical protein